MNNKNISQQIQILINQFSTKNYENVISKGNILLKKNPEYVILYNLVGSAYQNTGDYKNAKIKFTDGLKLDPKNLALINNLGLSHKNLLEYDLAERLFLKLIDLNKKYLNAYINLGNLKRDLNKFNEAIELYENAMSISNDNAIVLYSLALAHQGIGNFEKSRLYANQALKFNKNFTRADHLISQSQKYTKDNEHYLDLKKKLTELKNDNLEKVDIYFSLAKAEEDIGNIENASEYLIYGNKLKKKLTQYDVKKETNLFNDIKKKFSENNYDISKSSTKDDVIFILGMPRSGTSLVEQIISSHKQVFGGGELPILSSLIKDNFIDDERFLKENFKDILKDTDVLNKIREDYFNFVKYFKFSERYITDKAPLNFRWIGFINLIFPNAKIIHCTRDPKNNCLSMFKNLFEGSLNFTYSQDDLVRYYHNYVELMNFWKKNNSRNILEVKYENLIENNEYEVRNIINFCSLEWDEKCLEFHKNKSPIKTMSTSQARKPIYKSSINAFDKFKDYLTIIENKL